MSTKIGRKVFAVAALAAALTAAAPVFAEGHGGGGGHAGGGGAHFGGGARGFGGGGGFHGGAVGHAGFAGGGAGHPSYAGYGGGRVGGGYAGHAGYVGHVGGYGGGYYHGYSTGAHWGGGYWHGGYWPRAYYGLGFSWFLPVLPLAYATYWYDGLPYYYANDVYYTWDPSYDGYVATDPPPVADASGGAPAQGSAEGQSADMAAGAGSQIFMYPKNGQTAEQQATDKRECQQWASSQADPSHVDDYRRAMMACVEGRGYSAQ
jgi:hypothetical protein